MCLVGKAFLAPSEIQETLEDMFRPFGPISEWKVESDNDGVYQCGVKLAAMDRQQLASEVLGCEVNDGEMRVQIRMR